ncbi:UV-stimulated scaffold protein A isoform X4 [Myotis daubentonii]|uniref:UV-stimulated scaffold protein A isoform X4 n=1 Tax=Myotis daubentonii TaxID=98922 RepID=UPI002873C164|nr:UV-stimulated scaffold protein A isoform X4 [Myotis daubentonii]
MDQRLSELIEDLTTSGEPRLDPERMKELKKMCKSSEEQLSRAYHLLTARLRQEHAEVRLSAFQVAEELFARSHLFRLLVVSDFQGFLELTLGTDPRQPLPPPREAARRLRQAAARAVQGWSEKFGAAYKKLALGYHFLRHGQQVDFQDVHARTLAERKREEEKQRRLDRIYRERSEQAVREMEGSLRVQEDEDNCAVIQSARDALKLIQNKFLPAVRTWVQLFTRAGARGQHLEAAIDLKAELETALRRSQELDIEPEGPHRKEPWGVPQTAALGDEDEDEDDGDFVEVPEKEGYEACVPEHLWPEDGSKKDLAAQGLLARKRRKTDEEASDPTSAAAQLHRLRGHLPPAPCPSPRAPLAPEEAGRLAAERARAPVVPFGVDLCNWGQEQPAAGKVLKVESQHRFWKPSEVDEEVDSAEVSEVLRSRHITFAGSFEPVQHRCRAPRPDGRLCERQDRLKCPFHGKIIPRDDTGRPLHPEDRAREQRLQRQAGRSDWQDPEFMRDVEVATGVDLGSSRAGRRGKGKKRRHPGLTDLKQQADTARTRIAKKVFAKAAVQRVVTAMNQMDRKKHEKFANQFNYALS